jgi:hypothetical protein
MKITILIRGWLSRLRVKVLRYLFTLINPFLQELEGSAGFNLEFLPSQYWAKTYLMDGRINRFPAMW